MRIAVSSSGPGLDDQVTQVFGRAPYFVIVEINGDIRIVESVQNTAAMESRGAGILSAQLVASKGVSGVITGNMGPNAYALLSQAGITVKRAFPGTVRENVVRYNELPVLVPAGRGPGFGRGRGWI